MAHIRRHPKTPNRWQVRYVDGTGREHAKNFSRRTDAESFLVTIESEKLKGDWVDPRLSRTGFDDWTQRWWGSTSNLKQYTRDGYTSLLRVHIHPRFGNTPIGKISPLDIRQWVADLEQSGLSASRIRQAYFLVRQILGSAVDNGYLAKSPCVGIKLPRSQTPEMRFADEHDIETIADNVPDRYRTMIYVLAYGGTRWGETVALRRSRCETDNARLHIAESLSETTKGLLFGPTKTYQRRTIVLPAFVNQLLTDDIETANIANDDLVFTSPRSEPLRRGNFTRRIWHPAIAASGLPQFRVHDLRHTCAALLIAEGAHPKAIQAHLGHSSIQVTMDRYGHLFPGDAEDLAAKLNRRREQALEQPQPPRPGLEPPTL